MDLFVVLPKSEHVMTAELQLILSNFLLMKLAGQVSVTMADLKALARDYAGYAIHYAPDSESFTLTLKTRPDESPAPEKRHDVL